MQEGSRKFKYDRKFYNSKARQWLFPLVFMALICLLVQPVYAASFDCKKAGTEMEKTICSDSKLSQLDEKLAAAYREALEKAPQKGESLREGQRQWLRERNECADTHCIKDAYKLRLADLKLVSTGLASEKGTKSQQGAESSNIAATGSEATKEYPPYPDVWGYELPWPDLGQVFVYKMQNGDYAITYPFREKEEDKYFIKYFFSEKQKILTKEEYRLIQQRKSAEKYNITLKNGEHMTRFVFDAGGECTNYFSDNYFNKTDKTGRIVFKKMAFYLHDVYKKVTFLDLYELRKCAGPGEMLMRLENVGDSFIPLDDGTFLLLNRDGGFILRFDKDLNTKSELLNKKVYLIDRDFFVKNFVDKYRLDDSAQSYQTLHDELLKYFMSLKKIILNRGGY